MATVTVKGAAASAAQVANIRLLCQMAKTMGATAEQIAGALATMMQESTCVNMQGGNRDSAGLFQQRPSCGWGSYAQVTTPSYAIGKFLTPYLNYCKKGMDPITASDKVQGSAYPTAPARWLAESRKDVQVVMGSGDFGDVTSLGGGFGLDSTTRVMPYKFSRGNADQKETSWDCMGRLAQEVSWDRFMRAGVLWFVSEDWLARQTPRFVFSEGARGVLSITHDADARQPAAEATVSAVTDRWSVLPGDVARVTGEGSSADGLWLVYSTHRSIYNPTTDIALKRPVPKQDEPANQTQSTTVAVGGVTADRLGSSQIGGGASAGPAAAQAVYNAAGAMDAMKIPYSQAQRNLVARPSSADCSSSCSWVLLSAGLPLPGGVRAGQWAPVSGAFESWGAAGPGRWFTVMCSAEHIWIRFTGCGPAWRFDTSPWGCGDPDGPRLRYCARSLAGFTQRHWPGC